MYPDAIFALIPLGGMATAIVFMIGAYKLLSRWLDRRQVSGMAGEEVARLRAQIEELQELPVRVAELEERVDFAERMLAQARRDGLPGGT